MYAYCLNNPVMMVDPNGTNPFLTLGVLIAPEIVIIALLLLVLVVVLSPPVQDLIRDGIQAGADLIGNAVDSISQVASNLKDPIKEKINTTSVAISTAGGSSEKVK